MNPPGPDLVPGFVGDVLPIDEARRLAAVHRHQILDTLPDGTFDRITALAAAVLDVPIAIVSIVDRDRIWFKSAHGLDVTQVPRSPGLCASAILGDDLYILPDATCDPVALTNPLVAGEFGFRFYAAAPLITAEGYGLGTLCIIDTQPRTLCVREMGILRVLGELVARELELRIAVRRESASQAGAKQRAVADRQRAEEILRALQLALVPPNLPDVPGAELAVCYRPVEGYPVGGDFYDVFALPGQAWGIAIGDVCGKDSRAAGLAAAGRYAIRAAALERDTPARVLDLLNAALLLDAAGDARFCTAIYARLQLDEGALQLSVASAGHPLPLVLRRNGTVESVGGSGMVAGCFHEASFSDRAVALEEGDTVVFFTDGLTEAHCNGKFLGVEGVTRLLRSCTGRGAAYIANCLEQAALDGGTQRDDVAVMVLGVSGPLGASGARVPGERSEAMAGMDIRDTRALVAGKSSYEPLAVLEPNQEVR